MGPSTGPAWRMRQREHAHVDLANEPHLLQVRRGRDEHQDPPLGGANLAVDLREMLHDPIPDVVKPTEEVLVVGGRAETVDLRESFEKGGAMLEQRPPERSRAGCASVRYVATSHFVTLNLLAGLVAMAFMFPDVADVAAQRRLTPASAGAGRPVREMSRGRLTGKRSAATGR